MKHTNRKRSVLLVLILLFVSSPYANAEDAVATQVDIPYETFTLDNGLTVILDRISAALSRQSVREEIDFG